MKHVSKRYLSLLCTWSALKEFVLSKGVRKTAEKLSDKYFISRFPKMKLTIAFLGLCALRPVASTFSLLSFVTFLLLKKTLGLKLLMAIKLLLLLGMGNFSTTVYRSYQQVVLLPYQLNTSPPFNVADNLPQSSTDPLVVENVISFIKWLDDKNCINRLICEVGADADSSLYGQYGKSLQTFFGNFEDSPNTSAVYDYVQALRTGRLVGINVCREQFSACTHDMRTVMGNINNLFPGSLDVF